MLRIFQIWWKTSIHKIKKFKILRRKNKKELILRHIIIKSIKMKDKILKSWYLTEKFFIGYQTIKCCQVSILSYLKILNLIKIFFMSYGKFYFHFLPTFFAINSGHIVTFISGLVQKIPRKFDSVWAYLFVPYRLFLT